MDFALTLLGVSGATPAYGRFPTSQFLQVQNAYFLIDCGEGAQIQMDAFGIPRNRIRQIFISHLHGDHIFGLPGLLFSYALNGREHPLEIFSPPGLEEIIRGLLLPGGGLNYPISFKTFQDDAPALLFENEILTVHSIPLVHRIPTCGFLFREKAFEPNIRPEKIEEYQLDIDQILQVKKGEDLRLPDGDILKNEELTLPPWKPRSYAFVSDTAYTENILSQIEGADLLYHETTFGEDRKENAIETMHTTASQAAMIASRAKAGRLVTGHYSPRYPDLSVLLNEAKAIFPGTVLGEQGKKYVVGRKRMDGSVE